MLASFNYQLSASEVGVIIISNGPLTITADLWAFIYLMFYDQSQSLFLSVAQLTCVLLLSNFYQTPLILVSDFFPLPYWAAKPLLSLWPPTELLTPCIFA